MRGWIGGSVIGQPSDGEKPAPPSPAKVEETYAKFNAWKEKFEHNLVDMGVKLGGGALVTAGL